MTVDEYNAYVTETAEAIYHDLNCEQWLLENYLRHVGDGELDLDSFWYDDEEDNEDERRENLDSFLDAAFKWRDIKECASVLAVTTQNPDDVDSGLYEGCSVEQMLRTIAYECFNWDVHARMQELFEEDLDSVKAGTKAENMRTQPIFEYPNTNIQIGYWPRLRKFKFPATDGESTVPSPRKGFEKFKLMNGHGRMMLDKYNVLHLEGRTYDEGGYLVVLAKRVYVTFDLRLGMLYQTTKASLKKPADAHEMTIKEALDHAIGDGLVDFGWYEGEHG